MYKYYNKKRGYTNENSHSHIGSEKKLPSIIKSLKTFPDTVYQVTVHNEIVAEIKKPSMVKPGEAAAKILELRKKAVRKIRKYPVSENIKEYLYVAEGKD